MDIVAMITAVAPIISSLIGMILAKNQADADTIKAYQNMLDAAQQNGLITVQMQNDFLAMQAALQSQFASTNAKKV